MRKTKRALLVGVVLSLLLGQGLMGTHLEHAWAIDCELQRFNDFLDADAQYTDTFRSWYFDDPVSCADDCTATCNGSSNPQVCMSGCMIDCDISRFNLFTSAEDNLMQVAFRGCSYNPNVCGEARWRSDLCNAAANAHWQNPVYDENSNIDGNWMFFVSQELMACRAASGIDGCE